MQSNAIYTAVIRKKNIILSEYTDYSGNFEQIIKKMMKIIIEKNIEINIYKATILISKHKIFILKYSELYLILISDIKEENKEQINDYAYCFLYSILTQLNKLYKPEELQQAKSFSLIDFRNILENHITNFRSNIKYYKDYLSMISSYETENSLNNMKIQLNLSIYSIVQVHKEHPKEYDALEIKGSDISKSLNELSESLIDSNNSYNEYKKSKCCKITIIIIIIILLLGIGIFSFLKFYLHKI